MKEKEISLSTTTEQKVERQETGKACLNFGYEGQSSLEQSQIEHVQHMIRLRPPLFETDVSESLICQMYRVNFLKEKVKTSEFTVAVARCEELLQPCGVEDVQVMLETICSTFSCSAPNELGLKTYWELLKKYPAGLFPYVTLHICATYKYPRLPMPMEFLTYLDEEYAKASRFLLELKNAGAWALQLEQTQGKI